MKLQLGATRVTHLNDALRYESDATWRMVWALRNTPGIHLERDETRTAHRIICTLQAEGVTLSMAEDNNHAQEWKCSACGEEGVMPDIKWCSVANYEHRYEPEYRVPAHAVPLDNHARKER